MRSARVLAMALLAAAVAVVAILGLLPLQAAEDAAAPPPAKAVYAGGVVSHSWDWCTDCHYGVTDVFNATVVDASDGPNGTYALEVRLRHAYPNVGLRDVAVRLLPEGEAALEPRVNNSWTGDVRLGDTVRVPFTARPGDSAAFVQAQAAIEATDAHDLALVVEGPGGPWISDGARALEMAAIPRLGHVTEPAEFVALVTYEGCGDHECPPVANVTVDVEVWGPGVRYAEALDGLNSDLVFRYDLPGPPAETAPRVGLTVRPFHDHRLWEQPDEYDASTYRYAFTPVAEPAAPAPEPTVDAAWNHTTERVIMEREYAYQKLYVANGNKSSDDDEGAGSKFAHYMPVGRPIPPGAREVEARLNWTNALPGADAQWRLRFSNGAMLHFIEPAPDDAGEGYAVYRIVPEDDWFDDPALERGFWDFGLFVAEEPGAPVAFQGEVTLTVVARR